LFEADLQTCEIPSYCQLKIDDFRPADRDRSACNVKSTIKNIPETPNSGQGAKCPDRFLAKSG
jgi:hypothetical protein